MLRRNACLIFSLCIFVVSQSVYCMEDDQEIPLLNRKLKNSGNSSENLQKLTENTSNVFLKLKKQFSGSGYTAPGAGNTGLYDEDESKVENRQNDPNKKTMSQRFKEKKDEFTKDAQDNLGKFTNNVVSVRKKVVATIQEKQTSNNSHTYVKVRQGDGSTESDVEESDTQDSDSLSESEEEDDTDESLISDSGSDDEDGYDKKKRKQSSSRAHRGAKHSSYGFAQLLNSNKTYIIGATVCLISVCSWWKHTGHKKQNKERTQDEHLGVVKPEAEHV